MARSRSTSGLMICGILVLTCLASPVAVASEEQAPADQVIFVGGHGGPPPEPTEAQLQDLALMAEQDGTSLATAIEAFAWREPFSQLVNRVRAGYPDAFAGSGIEPPANGQPWVAFKADPPPGALRLLGSFPLRLAVIQGRGYNEAELDNRLVETHYAVSGSPIVQHASSGYDIETGVITVEVQLTADAPPDSLSLNTLSAISGSSVAVPVRLVLVDAVRAGEDTVYGGGKLSTCTAGFAVAVAGSSTRGLATAAHCSNAQDYEGRGVLTFRAAHDGTWGDVQWHSSSETVSDDFYYNFGVRRDVGRVGFANKDDRLCKFGHTTGAHCDYVYQLNHCNFDRCHLTLMDGRYAEGGDSGGPWYYGNTAYGIHSGYKFWNFGYRDAFTPSSYVDDAIPGIYVTIG